MKKLLGVTKQEITNEMQFCVEQEYVDGHRFWHQGNFKEMSKLADSLSKHGMFSDFDICCKGKQPEKLHDVFDLYTDNNKLHLKMNELFDIYASEEK